MLEICLSQQFQNTNSPPIYKQQGQAAHGPRSSCRGHALLSSGSSPKQVPTLIRQSSKAARSGQRRLGASRIRVAVAVGVGTRLRVALPRPCSRWLWLVHHPLIPIPLALGGRVGRERRRPAQHATDSKFFSELSKYKIRVLMVNAFQCSSLVSARQLNSMWACSGQPLSFAAAPLPG
jgi:hypothetical protein